MRENSEMNAILLSLGLGIVRERAPGPMRVGFVPTAGHPYDDPSFVRDDRARLVHMGYELQDIDFSQDSTDQVSRAMASVDALFVAGGNTFYLLDQIRKKRLEDPIREFLHSDKLYIGASAGAVILAPTTDPIKTLDDPSIVPDMKDMSGLDSVDFLVLPHYGKEKYLPKYEKIMAEHGDEVQLVTLRDDQALIVHTRDGFELVDSELILQDLD